MEIQCIHYQNQEKGRCFPPNQRGAAGHLLLDVDDDGPLPPSGVPFCTGHLQRLMSFIMKGVCDDAGIEFLVDDAGVAYIDPEISAEWEAESDAWEAQKAQSAANC